MEEYNREGIMCLWLGPTYPLVLIYKPDLAEVRYSLANTPLSLSDHSRNFVLFVDSCSKWLLSGAGSANSEAVLVFRKSAGFVGSFALPGEAPM